MEHLFHIKWEQISATNVEGITKIAMINYDGGDGELAWREVRSDGRGEEV